MKVLFLMFSFPDMNRSFNMYTTLVEEFQKNGHEVYVLAPALYQGKTKISIEKDIQVLRVNSLPLKNVSNYIKGISNILLPYQFSKALKKFYPKIKFDLVITPTPPITFVDLTASIKKTQGSLNYLILRDIFPQNAVDLGFMKAGSFIHRYFRAKERKLYDIADFIGCMSPGNKSYIIKHNEGLTADKIHELKNYQQLYSADISKNTRQLLKEKYGIEGKFVVVFGGNMGKPQQLENVLELARNCVEYSNVIFLLIGEGTAMKKLAKSIIDQRIANIKIQGTISKQEYQDLISVCDIGLISLHKSYTIPNIPSKTLDYFNVGLPVLASIDKSTDYKNVLDETKAGLWSYAGDHSGFKKNFDKLYHNHELRYKMGRNGRVYFERNLTPELAYQTIISRITEYIKCRIKE